MKKLFLIVFSLVLSAVGFAQAKIQLRSADKAECVKSDYTSLKASFSFSGLEANNVESERGVFSELSMLNTVIGGNEGDPQIPVVNELIAVPFGANPTITVTSYSSTDYKLEDYGINTLVPRQPSLRKDKKPEEVPFLYNESAYQTRGLRSEPQAVVQVVGTMRGVRLAKMTIEPVSYDPVNNTIRVFNDIEVEVSFDGADKAGTEEMLLKTFSPYFEIVYKQLFNGRAVLSAYDDHPDLYQTPVKMLVVTTSTYTSSTAFQNWLNWKKQKGIDVDVQTVTSGTASSTILSTIQSRYNATHPTFLVIVGDESVVKPYKTNWSCGSTYGNCVNDLEYASMDGDVYHDMFMSRMSVSSTTELSNLVNKILTYEKYTMSDPSYLDNSLLVAGWDSSWTNRVGKPTIQYANNNYYNSAHGINPTVYITTGSGQTAAYNNINNVGFLNYTAHGDIQELADPEFTNSNVSSMTNNDKYLWIVANCCLTANWGNSSYYPCLGETMIRAANKGAFGYIGSIPESYWYEDYYFGVGAFSYVASTVQTPSSTTTGMYDAAFDDTGFNTLNSMPYIGNVAVTYAHAANYTSSVTDEYYWRAYQCLGDGSVMPYLKNPSANTVTHASTLQIGATTFNVKADAGSYVAITVNNEIIGVEVVPSNGSIDVPITAQTTTGTAMIVVTRNQRQPYIATINIIGGTQYNIEATANPTAGGTVSGTGKYYEDTECTLVATPNAPQYEFTNWKKDNSVVSTNATYTFTVSSSTAGTYTANFTELTAHSITCNATSNGNIYANKTNAYKGEIINLSATPANGYVLSAWSVKDASNNTITVTDNQFTMPDSNVTVSATFTKGYDITLASVMNGSISADPTCALQGTTINLTATPASGYNLESWIVYKTGDLNTTVTVNGDSFTMPNYDVTVSAIFSKPNNSDVTIGSGTSTNAYLPTYAYYNYSLTQQIYTASEVGSAGTITAVAFKVANSKSTTRNIDVYLSHTSNSSFSGNSAWVSQSTSYRVFSGNVTFASSGWTTITFSTPFEYDGTSNLLLTVDDNTGTYVSSSSDAPSFYVYSSTSNSAIYKYDDYTNYNPASISTSGTRLATKDQVVFTKVVSSAEGFLSVSPTTLSGFIAVAGSTASEAQSVSIVGSNLQSNVTITLPAGYEASTSATGNYSTSLTLTPSNGSLRQMVYVRLQAALNQNNYNGTMTIASGSTSTTVSLSGTVNPGSGTQYTISVNASPANGGTFSGAGTYYENGTCTLNATANTGYAFAGWQQNGNMVSTDASYSFIVTGDASYTAIFTEIPLYNITISEVPNGTISANTTTAYPGDVVNLSVNPNSGFQLNRWLVYKTGDIESTIEVTNNSFVMPEYDVTVFAIIKDDFQEVTVGSGTDISYGYVLPTHVYYSYCLSQQIYTSAEVGDAGTITAFQLYFAGTSSGAASTTGPRTFKIYMTHTNNSTVSSWTTVSSSGPVYQGTMTFEQLGWYTFTLDTPFEYNGTSNLMLTVDDCTGSYVVSQRHYFYDYNTGSTRAIYDVTDDGEYDPTTSHSASTRTCQYNNQIIFEKGVAGGPTLTALPNPLEGFSYKEGEGPSDVFDFAVIGVDLTANVTITAPEHFEICATENGTFGSTLTLTKTDLLTANVYVRMKAGLAQGNYSESITLTSGDATTQVNLLGQVNQGDVVYYTITAVASPAEGGTITGTGQYADQGTVRLTAIPNEGYIFVNWTENGVEVSTNAYWVFTSDSNRDLVANFIAAVTQNQTLNAGWNWFSSYIELSNGGLSLVENALGSNGVQIKSQQNFVTYSEGEWFGGLTEMNNEEMYQIRVGNTEEISFSGPAANPNNHPITLANGWNWIGYPMDETLDIATALGGFQPMANDMIKGRNSYTTYVEGYGWWGTLNALTPGNGYMYRSYNNSSTNLTYQRGNKINDVVLNNVETYWTPASEDFAFNGNVMATVNADNLNLSENMEIGAFVNGECRGAAKLMFVEPLNQYVAFLTIFGNDDEEVSFKVYNDGETFTANEQVVYTNNMVIGTVTDPFVLHVNVDNLITFFPNPVERGQEARLDLPNMVRGKLHVQVFNALGVEVRNEVVSNTISGIMASGIYTLRVMDEEGNVYYGKLIVR